MAQTILSTVVSPDGMRIVNEGTSAVVLSNLKIKKVEIETPSEVADIPFAVGDLSDDQVAQAQQDADLKSGKVLRPVRITIQAMSPDSVTTAELATLFLDQSVTVQVTSKSIISSSMAMESVYITQDKDHLSVDVLEIILEQVQPKSAASKTPEQPADQNTAGITTVVPKDLTDTVEDLYNKVLTLTGDI